MNSNHLFVVPPSLEEQFCDALEKASWTADADTIEYLFGRAEVIFRVSGAASYLYFGDEDVYCDVCGTFYRVEDPCPFH
jgi:hypothetical protein